MSPFVTATVCASGQRLEALLGAWIWPVDLLSPSFPSCTGVSVDYFGALWGWGQGCRGVGMLPAPLRLPETALEAGVALGCAVPCAGAGCAPTQGILGFPGSSAQRGRGQHRDGMPGHGAARASGCGKGTVVWMCRWGGLGPSTASIERITHRWAGGPVWISPAGSLGNLCMGETQLSRFMAALA